MAEELLSLKWNNHQAHFVDILTFLREKDMFIDATIACGGKVYSAHKFVLSTCSDYFKQIFTKNPGSNPIVFMKDVSCRDIEALLDFMYNGEVSVPQSSLGSLIKTAEGLQIKGLAVPDDPPLSKRQLERDKREISSMYADSRSPPPKRRARHQSPSRRLSNHQPPANRPSSRSSEDRLQPDHRQSNGSNSNKLGRTNSPAGTESTADRHSPPRPRSRVEDGGLGDESKTDSIQDEGGGGGCDAPDHLDPGPSLHSKQEEVEIKQEDVVDLGADDDEDLMGDGNSGGGWGHAGVSGDGGPALEDDSGGGAGGDALSSADNSVNFSDMLLPPGGEGEAAGGDSAMIHNYGTPNHFFMDSSAYRPHVCTYCGRRFKRKDHRVEHERIHTGERPFACGFCPAAFVQKQQLVGHQKRRHGLLLSANRETSRDLSIDANTFTQYKDVLNAPLCASQDTVPDRCQASTSRSQEGSSSVYSECHSSTYRASDARGRFDDTCPLSLLSALAKTPQSRSSN